MKLIKMIGLSAITFFAAIPFAGVMPTLAVLQNSEPVIAQAAKQEAPIQLKLTAERKSTLAVASGQVEWKPLDSNASVLPGETIRYIVIASNTTSRNMRNLSVTQPVPDGMVYIMQSATKASAANSSVNFSIDGGKSFSPKPVIRVRGRDGKVEERPAPPEAYTHVRWNFGETLPANSQAQVSYQVRVK